MRRTSVQNNSMQTSDLTIRVDDAQLEQVWGAEGGHAGGVGGGESQGSEGHG